MKGYILSSRGRRASVSVKLARPPAEFDSGSFGPVSWRCAARAVAVDDGVEAVLLARIEELIGRQRHPVLPARGPELGDRFQPGGIVEGAGLQHHDAGQGGEAVEQAGAAAGAEEAMHLAAAVGADRKSTRLNSSN